MKKIFTITIGFIVISLSGVYASVTLNLGFGTLYSSTNQAITLPTGARINFLAVEGNGSGTWSSFGNLNDLFEAQTSNWAPAGTRLIGEIFNDNSGGPGLTGGSFIYNYSGSFQPGDEILMVVYPTLDNSDTSPSLGTIGNFFRTNTIIDSSDIAWIAPADGGAYNLFALTIDTGVGSVPNNTFTSGAGAAGGNGFTTVPEPATYALLAMSALGMGGYMIRRRRR